MDSAATDEHIREIVREEIAAIAEHQAVTAMRSALIVTMNTIGAALLGDSYTNVTEAPVDDDTLRAIYRDVISQRV